MEKRSSPNATWLCPTELDRARMLDMLRRGQRPALFLFVVGVGTSILLTVRIGPVVIVPFVLRTVLQGLLSYVHVRRARPEYWLFAAEGCTLVTTTVVVALTGGVAGPMAPVFVLPLVLSTARYSPRGAAVLMTLTVLGLVAADVFAVDRGHRLDDLRLPMFVAVLLSVAVCARVMSGAEREHRRQSQLDPLTGLLNRLALAQRFEEIRQQAATSGAEVCLVAADVDHFKDVNDSLGHDVGDAVLRDLAYVLRTNTRTFSLLYRIGGEEFVVLLPGLALEEGAAVAERLRAAVAAARPSGLEVTMSFGVASAAGADVAFDTLFAAADARLYEAKAQGRNRVVPGPPAGVVDDRAVGVLAADRAA